MNRQGAQSLRGLPSGFPGQQQQQQQSMSQTRSVSSRLPPGAGGAGAGGAGGAAGKLGTTGSGSSWAFGTGNVGLPGQRPGQPLTSFAQTIGGSQPATPLDMSEFPSLSNNQTLPSQSTWTTSGSRPLGTGSNLRLQQTSNLPSQSQLPSQQQQTPQQEDGYSSNVQILGNQGAFRFGGQTPTGQASLAGFGSAPQAQQNRGNGLLNALSSSSRLNQTNRVLSPSNGIGSIGSARSPTEGSQPLNGVSESDARGFPGSQNAGRSSAAGPSGPPAGPAAKTENGSGTSDMSLPKPTPGDKSSESSPAKVDEDGHLIEDPLAHMKDIDRWGLKGFTYMMNNYPDFAACVTGQDVNSYGLDLSSPELISTQIYSLLDNEPPRPAPVKHRLPDCYQVHNVAPLDSKISNLNDEALMFMFYSNPHDISQVLAAQELHNRNWRYHKKLKMWLTKDDMMVPQSLGNGQERGYYIFFDVKQWHKERREFTLIYDDLESLPATNRGIIA